MMYQKTKPYNPLIQIAAMRSRYPQFKAKRMSGLEIEFIGVLQPLPELPVYTVSITYRGNSDPKVKIISPHLVENPPHFYRNTGTLCLYSSENFKWSREKLVADNIISWTASWIYFYEVWLQTGNWYGPEA